MDRYSELHKKYLRHAEQALKKKDYSQASEKFWGAVAVLVKHIASVRGWKHSTHRDLLVSATRLETETKDPELGRLFSVAVSLHANFYENYLLPEAARHRAQDIRRLIAKLQNVNGKR